MMQYLHEHQELQKVPVREDCYLRPLETQDAKYILAILNDDQLIREYVTVAARMHTADDVMREIEAYKTDEEGLIRYTIVYQERCVGLVSLWKDPGYFGQTPEPGGYGFGYFIDPALRGRGIVTDAVSALMQRASQVLDIKRFIAFSEDENVASGAVLRKLGFTATDDAFSEPTHGWIERKYVKEISLK